MRTVVDKALARDQLQALKAMREAWGLEAFCQSMIWILAKQAGGVNLDNLTEDELKLLFAQEPPSRLIPFRFNRIQRDLASNVARMNRLLKPRQAGYTTWFLLVRLFVPVVTDEGKTGLLISQNSKYATWHFQIARRAYRHFGSLDPKDDKQNTLSISLRNHLLHTEIHNRRELTFDFLDSRVIIESAEVEEAGQGVSVHHVVASEVPRWEHDPEATISNVKGALVPGGTFDEEGTANGAAGYFFEAYMRSLDAEVPDAKPHFHGWWMAEDYVDELTPDQAKEIKADLDADERALIQKFHKELEPIAWVQDMNRIAWRRRTKIEQRGNFDEKYPEDALTAFLMAGKHYFDRDILIARKRELVNFKPVMNLDNGSARIFKQRVPGRRYLIGADPATGRQISKEDTDFCAAVVLDLETGEEMAAYRARVTPEDLAYDLADLGRYFNNAVIAVERTGDGGTTILVLKGECKYGAVYRHRDWWRRERQLKVVDFEGFPTTPKTRPLALNWLNKFILDHPDLIWDEQFINEALVFVRDEKGKPQASEGAHDDTVSCRWIAHAVRRVLLGWWDPTQPSVRQKYIPADQLTDDAA